MSPSPADRRHLRLVVVPMKDPSRAKTRLGEVLDPAQRAELAISLFEQTVRQLGATQAVVGHGFDLATVTTSPLLASLAQQAGMTVIEEGGAQDLNAAVTRAATWAAARGYASLAVLPGDLAAPSLDDLVRLLDRPTTPEQVVLCASVDGGTNALLLPLPVRLRFRYGPGSFWAHRAEAEAAGLPLLTPTLHSLRHDVDRREDLRALAPTLPALMAVEP